MGLWQSSHEATAKYNNFSLDNVVDGVALPSCAEQGNYVWLKRPNLDWEGPFRVVDCAGYWDQYNVAVNRKESVEVGFKTAVNWGMATFEKDSYGEWQTTWLQRRVDDVIVSKINPKCLPHNIVPVNSQDWFRENISFYKTYDEYYWHYLGQLQIIDKYYDGYSMWRVDGEWLKFDLNSLDDCKKIGDKYDSDQ